MAKNLLRNSANNNLNWIIMKQKMLAILIEYKLVQKLFIKATMQ